MKKVVVVLGFFAFFVVIASNTDIQNQLNNDVNMSTLLRLNTANAECIPASNGASAGRCSFSGRCFYDVTVRDCAL
ncbi:hypothetical protein [Flavobacterium chungangense]|uniref:Uncharacterized protein n=1 Tax=Flavobacterium chungangense TaxID=554283 RepID=A0A6V6ZDL8_9FLAO|nr:hypothetical protein [Flavobacterium chungangense]CAD0009888.1 hypothetical protein FLACHUCJ7_04528 [Flavobacterium chungangense]